MVFTKIVNKRVLIVIIKKGGGVITYQLKQRFSGSLGVYLLARGIENKFKVFSKPVLLSTIRHYPIHVHR